MHPLNIRATLNFSTHPHSWLALILFTVLTVMVNLAAGVFIARAAVSLSYFRATQDSTGVILEWATASESDHAGFYVNRRQPPVADFTRISNRIVPKGDALTGATYEYTDSLVQDGATYDYILEMVDTTGNSEFTDPVTVTYGVITPTPSLTATSTQGTAGTATITTTGTLNTPTQTRTPTRTPTATSSLLTPTRTATSLFSTSTPRATSTLFGTQVVTITQTPTITNTPTWTATFVPLPRLTLLFPALSPTSTATLTPSITPTSPPPPGSGPVGKALVDPRLGILGGIVVLLWLALGGFLIVYLRRLGY